MRERLIESLLRCDKEYDVLSCYNERPKRRQAAEIIADGLLASGWMRPPCKVGDTIYILATCRDICVPSYSGSFCPYEDVCRIDDCISLADVERPFPVTVEAINIGDHGIYSIFFEQTKYEYLSTEIGKKVFLTREEAEAALKGR